MMKTLLPALASALALLGLAGTAPAAPAAAPPGQFAFQRLNRSYGEVVSEIEPIRQGPVSVRLSSPRHDLTVRSHLLRLEPGAGGSHSAELRVDFMGKGWLVADVNVAGIAGIGGRLEDEVTVPLQSQTVEGRVKLHKVAEGYLVTPEQLPRRLAVRARSGVGTRIVGFCDRAALVLLSNLDCPALDRALSTLVVPLPPPGESYLLAESDLTVEERRRIDAYLARQP
jgi:hypothetical protein